MPAKILLRHVRPPWISTLRDDRDGRKTLFQMELFASDWDIIPSEDVFVKRELKARIQNYIVKVIDSVLDTGSSTDEEV
jgi:hypothetical protein